MHDREQCKRVKHALALLLGTWIVHCHWEHGRWRYCLPACGSWWATPLPLASINCPFLPWSSQDMEQERVEFLESPLLGIDNTSRFHALCSGRRRETSEMSEVWSIEPNSPHLRLEATSDASDCKLAISNHSSAWRLLAYLWLFFLRAAYVLLGHLLHV